MSAILNTDTRRAGSDTQGLWRRYHRLGDARLRDELIMSLTPIVRYLVHRKGRELPAHLDIGDLHSAGLEALVWSVDHYEAGHGATLEQFAWTRVRGAILDELRRQDWAPRSVRRGERRVARAASELTSSLGRRPSEEEIADAAGMSAEELSDLRADLGRVDVSSLNESVRSDGEEEGMERVETLTDDRWSPERGAMSAAASQRVREALAQMPEREQRMAELLYGEGLSQREVSEIFGVTESRVSQMHSALRRQMRAALRDDRMLFEEV